MANKNSKQQKEKIIAKRLEATPQVNFFSTGARPSVTTVVLVSLFIFGIAFFARAYPDAGFFFKPIVPGFRNFEIFDSYYHLRRTEMVTKTYPRVSFFDTYHYYPDPPPVPWPPGYVLFLATLAKPIQWISPSPLVFQTVLGLLPCLIESLTVLLFLFIFSCYVPFRIAATAAILFSVSIVNLLFSSIGYIDHHYFINFMVACLVSLFILYERRPTLSRAILLGLGIGAGTFFNVSFIQFSLLLLLATTGLAAVRKHDALLQRTSTAVFAGALVASVLSGFSTPVGRALLFRYDQTSLFQPVLILIAGIFFGLLKIWVFPFQGSLRKKWAVTAILGAAFVLLLGVSFSGIIEGAAFLFQGNILNSIQGEEASIRETYRFWPRYFTVFVFFAPIGLWQLVRQAKQHPAFGLLFGLFFFFGALSGLAHFLYFQYFFPWYALALSVGFWWVIWTLRGSHAWAIPLIVLPFFGPWVWMTADHLKPQSREKVAHEEAIEATLDSFEWLGQNSPPTAFHEFGDGLPEYSVMAHRDYGHMIAVVAKRPVVVSPFSTPDFLPHMKDYSALLFTKQEEEAVQILETYKSRYWIIDNKDNLNTPFFLEIIKGGPGYATYAEHAKSLPFLVRNNLLYFDGELRWKRTPGIKHFRLIYEVKQQVSIPLKSKQGVIKHKFNGLKIFERVPGAVIKGRGAKPGSLVTVKLPLKTNSGRSFTYSNFTAADNNGRYEFTVPYASTSMDGSAVQATMGVYFLESNLKSLGFVSVSDQAVRSGAVVLAH